MAKIGCKGFWFADYDESTGALAFTNGKKVAKACSVELSYAKSEATLYADNGKIDNVRAVTGVTITATPHDIGEDFNEIMGILSSSVSINGEAQELYTIGSSNEGEYKGFSFITQKRDAGVTTAEVTIVAKAKFYSAESETAQSMQESISFDTSSVVGEAFLDCNSNYVYKKEFDTESEAEAFIETLFGIAAAA